MTSLFLKNILYLLVFALFNLVLFSVSSTFHKLLGYDLNTLEEWLYHNRLSLITISKVATLLMFTVLPNIHYLRVDQFKKSYHGWIALFLKSWKIDNKMWIVQLLGCLILYSLFYDVQINDKAKIFDNGLEQVAMCLVFWGCDIIFVRKIYQNNIFINFEYNKLINASLQSVLILLTTSIVTYLSWFDLFQLYLVLVCVFYLLQSHTSVISGYSLMLSFFIIFSLFQPMNYLINSEEIKFYLIAEGFSLPWSFIFLVYFLIVLYINRHSDQIYKMIFSKIVRK